MQPYLILDAMKNQVTDVERSFLDVAVMIAPDALEVTSCLNEGIALGFFDRV